MIRIGEMIDDKCLYHLVWLTEYGHIIFSHRPQEQRLILEQFCVLYYMSQFLTMYDKDADDTLIVVIIDSYIYFLCRLQT